MKSRKHISRMLRLPCVVLKPMFGLERIRALAARSNGLTGRGLVSDSHGKDVLIWRLSTEISVVFAHPKLWEEY